MGKRGPAPKPTNLRILEGNPSGRPLNAHEPQPEKLTWAEPPERFGESKKQIWAVLIPMLSRIGLFTEADYRAAYRYVDWLFEYERAMSVAQETPNMIISRNEKGEVSGWQPSPPLAMARKVEHELRWFEMQFGLTPSARTSLVVTGQSPEQSKGINVPAKQPEDPFAPRTRGLKK